MENGKQVIIDTINDLNKALYQLRGENEYSVDRIKMAIHRLVKLSINEYKMLGNLDWSLDTNNRNSYTLTTRTPVYLRRHIHGIHTYTDGGDITSQLIEAPGTDDMQLHIYIERDVKSVADQYGIDIDRITMRQIYKTMNENETKHA